MSTVKKSPQTSPERPEWIQGSPSRAQVQKQQRLQSGRNTPSQGSETDVEVAERRAAFQNKFADKKVIVGYNGEHAMMLPFVPLPAGQNTNTSASPPPVDHGSQQKTGQPSPSTTKTTNNVPLDHRSRKLLGPPRPVKEQQKKGGNTAANSASSSPNGTHTTSNNNDAHDGDEGSNTLSSTYPNSHSTHEHANSDGHPSGTSLDPLHSNTPNPKIATQKPMDDNIDEDNHYNNNDAVPPKRNSFAKTAPNGSPSKSPTKFVAPPPKESLKRYRELQESLASTAKTGGLGANITDETIEKRNAALKRNEYGKVAAAATLGIGSEERIQKAKERLEKERKEKLAAQKAARKEHEEYLLKVDQLRHKGESNYQPSTHVIGGGSPTSHHKKGTESNTISHQSPSSPHSYANSGAAEGSATVSPKTIRHEQPNQKPSGHQHQQRELSTSENAQELPKEAPKPITGTANTVVTQAAVADPETMTGSNKDSNTTTFKATNKESALSIETFIEYPADLIDLFAAANRESAIAIFEAQRSALEEANNNGGEDGLHRFSFPNGASTLNHPMGPSNLLVVNAVAAAAAKSTASTSATLTNTDLRVAQDLQAAQLQALAHAYLPPFIASSTTLALQPTDTVMMRAHKLDLFKRLLAEIGGCDLKQYGMIPSPVDPEHFSREVDVDISQFRDIPGIGYSTTGAPETASHTGPSSAAVAAPTTKELATGHTPYIQGLGTVATSYVMASSEGSPMISKANSLYTTTTSNSPKENTRYLNHEDSTFIPARKSQVAVAVAPPAAAYSSDLAQQQAQRNEQIERLRRAHEEDQKRLLQIQKTVRSDVIKEVGTWPLPPHLAGLLIILSLFFYMFSIYGV